MLHLSAHECMNALSRQHSRGVCVSYTCHTHMHHTHAVPHTYAPHIYTYAPHTSYAPAHAAPTVVLGAYRRQHSNKNAYPSHPNPAPHTPQSAIPTVTHTQYEFTTPHCHPRHMRGLHTDGNTHIMCVFPASISYVCLVAYVCLVRLVRVLTRHTCACQDTRHTPSLVISAATQTVGRDKT